MLQFAPTLTPATLPNLRLSSKVLPFEPQRLNKDNVDQSSCLPYVAGCWALPRGSGLGG